jgi:uncharacterized protein
MRLTGSRQFRATPQALWEFLLTPERLQQCLPGCERLEATGQDTFTATMQLGIGFLKGSYSGTIRVAEQRRPEHLVLVVQGGGVLGSLDARGTLTFRPLAGGLADLQYEGEATVGGRISAVGEFVMRATADRVFGRFLSCMAAHVER